MFVGIFVLLLGVLLGWLGWRNRQKVKASMSWPSVNGQMVASKVQRKVDVGDEDSGTTISYSLLVIYDYQVAGKSYQGTQFSFQDKSFNSEAKAVALLASFQAGNPVEVFYDPASPGSAVLERQAHGNIFLLILGPVLFIAGIVMMAKAS